MSEANLGEDLSEEDYQTPGLDHEVAEKGGSPRDLEREDYQIGVGEEIEAHGKAMKNARENGRYDVYCKNRDELLEIIREGSGWYDVDATETLLDNWKEGDEEVLFTFEEPGTEINYPMAKALTEYRDEGDFGYEEAVSFFTRQLEYGSTRSARILGNLGYKGGEVEETYLQALQEEEGALPRDEIKAVGEIGTEEKAVPFLKNLGEKALESDEPYSEAQGVGIAYALTKIGGKEAAKYIGKIISDGAEGESESEIPMSWAAKKGTIEAIWDM